MNLKRKHIELVEVSTEFCLDMLFTNELYNEPFMVETKQGDFHLVVFKWDSFKTQFSMLLLTGMDRQKAIILTHPKSLISRLDNDYCS